MAYLRASDTCDVYFFAHVEGGYECCGCLLNRHKCVRCIGDFAHSAAEEAVLHLQAHIKAGHRGIGSDVIDQIFGYQERTPDLVLQEMMDKVRVQGGKIFTYDADVPADLRVSDEDVAKLEPSQAVYPESMIEEVLKLMEKK